MHHVLGLFFFSWKGKCHFGISKHWTIFPNLLYCVYFYYCSTHLWFTITVLYHPHMIFFIYFLFCRRLYFQISSGGSRGWAKPSSIWMNFWRFSEREGGHFRFFHPSIIQRKCCRFVQKIVIYLLKAREGDKGRSENLWKFIQFDEEKLKSFSTRWKNWDMCCLIGRDVTRSWRLAKRSEQLVSFTKECL